jgi:hypothetical protein
MVLLTELDLTNESQPMIKSDRPPHLTSPRRGEGFWGGYSVKIVDPAIMCDFAIALDVILLHARPPFLRYTIPCE